MERRYGSAARREPVAVPRRNRAHYFWAALLVRALPQSIPVFKGQARTGGRARRINEQLRQGEATASRGGRAVSALPITFEAQWDTQDE
jgi:hypothetical protein